MAEAVETVVTEDPQPIETAESIASHQAQFGADRPEPSDDLDDPKPSHHAAAQRRERETGKFNGGMKPGPKPKAFDQSEVDEATRRLKTAEEPYFKEIPKKDGESDRAYRLRVRAEVIERHAQAAPKLKQLEAEVSRLRAQGASPAVIAKAEAKVETAAADPEPFEDDPKYGGDYSKFLKDQARWAAREALREDRAAEAAQRQKSERESSTRQTLDAFRGRVDAARSKYTDFDQVALHSQTRIPEGSAIDTFILDDDAGPDVLYHLQSHGEELDELLAMPVLKQIKHLALLSQRLSSHSSGSAGTTGSAPERIITKPLPKPPNPVRTEAQRANDAPPPTDGSLGSIDAHRRAFGKR